MTVQQIVPYAKYVTNGADSVYTVNFFIEDKENLFIKLNDVVVSMNDYNYLKDVNGIEFHTPLLANQKLEIFRKTKLERTTNFESFNNTFRPEVLNKDLDKIWLNLQEQSHKVDQYDLDYTYSVSTANQALKEVKDAQARADDAYELADLTNTETRPINRGGTGAASSEDARTNLNVHSKEEVVSLIQSGGTGTVVTISGGGTGADNIADARTNLDVYSKEEINQRAMSFPTGFIRHVLLHRSKIEDGDLALDGQLISRTDYPELWKVAQNSGLLITDTAWLSDPLKRIAYSSGDGETNFRLPDYNGIQDQSLKSPVLRGDGYSSSGTALSDAIRNIKGTFIGGSNWNFTELFTRLNTVHPSINGGGGASQHTYEFNASKVVPTADENRPVSAFGIYVVVAKGRTEKAPSSGNNPTLTGGNTWNGSQDVQGNLTVSGKLEANIKPLLNATGAAPISACRAWICFDSTTAGVVIKASNNIQSIVRTSLGRFVITFIDEMPHSDYIVLTGTRADSSTSNSTLNLVVNESYNVATQTAKTTKTLSVAYASTNGLYDGYGISLGVFC